MMHFFAARRLVCVGIVFACLIDLVTPQCQYPFPSREGSHLYFPAGANDNLVHPQDGEMADPRLYSESLTVQTFVNIENTGVVST